MTHNRTVAGAVSDRTKRPLRWAGALLLGGCVACCAAPLLIAVGAGGAVSAFLANANPWLELLAGGTAAAVVVGMVGMRKSPPRSAGCDCDASAPASPQLFASGKAAVDEPIVCTADLRDQATVQGQLDGYRAAFESLHETERFPGGFRWIFAHTPELAAQLAALARSEHQCCAFFEFDVRVDGDRIVWQTTAAESAHDVLEEFSRLPERLKAEQDISALKRPFTTAGLSFAVDGERGE